MKRLFAFLAWSLCFFVLLLALDQLMVHERFTSPGLHTVQSCYLDFRQRLLSLAPFSTGPSPAVAPVPTLPPAAKRPAPPPNSIESAIGQSEVPSPASRPQDASNAPRYVYVDGHGQLQFATSLKDIPAAFRKGAQHLDH